MYNPYLLLDIFLVTNGQLPTLNSCQYPGGVTTTAFMGLTSMPQFIAHTGPSHLKLSFSSPVIGLHRIEMCFLDLATNIIGRLRMVVAKIVDPCGRWTFQDLTKYKHKEQKRVIIFFCHFLRNLNFLKWEFYFLRFLDKSFFS